MAKASGRSFLIKKGGTSIAAVRTKSFAWAGEPIDITTDDDAGFRTLLAAAGQQTLDISCEGLTDTQVLRDLALTVATSKLLTDLTLTMDNGDAISGDFFMTSYEESGTYNDAITFSASFQSAEAWTFTPSA